jgi:hypothetical protein
MAKKRWKDMPPWARRAILVGASVQISLMAAAQADISRRSAADINGSKLRWRLISMINLAGPILYFTLGRRRRPVS